MSATFMVRQVVPVFSSGPQKPCLTARWLPAAAQGRTFGPVGPARTTGPWSCPRCRPAGEATVHIGVVMIVLHPRELALGLNGPGHYLHWGVIQISLANLIVIGLMLAVFGLALVLPFPGRRRR